MFEKIVFINDGAPERGVVFMAALHIASFENAQLYMVCVVYPPLADSFHAYPPFTHTH